MDTLPASIEPPADETSVPTPAVAPSRRLTLVDAMILLGSTGAGLLSARYLQKALRVAWNWVGTAPWPAYATQNELFALSLLLGLVMSGPVLLSSQVYRGRRRPLGVGEFAWLLSAGALLAMVAVSACCESGLAYLFVGFIFLAQLVLCVLALREVLRGLFDSDLRFAWTDGLGLLACLALEYGIYFALYVGTIDGGMLSSDD